MIADYFPPSVKTSAEIFLLYRINKKLLFFPFVSLGLFSFAVTSFVVLQMNLDKTTKDISLHQTWRAHLCWAESAQYRCFLLKIKSHYWSFETCQHICCNLCLSCYQCFYIWDFKVTDVKQKNKNKKKKKGHFDT